MCTPWKSHQASSHKSWWDPFTLFPRAGNLRLRLQSNCFRWKIQLIARSFFARPPHYFKEFLLYFGTLLCRPVLLGRAHFAGPAMWRGAFCRRAKKWQGGHMAAGAAVAEERQQAVAKPQNLDKKRPRHLSTLRPGQLGLILVVSYIYILLEWLISN